MNASLICDWCGELGAVLKQDGRFAVTCDREGEFCCRTALFDKRREAVAAWQKHHEDRERPATPEALSAIKQACLESLAMLAQK